MPFAQGDFSAIPPSFQQPLGVTVLQQAVLAKKKWGGGGESVPLFQGEASVIHYKQEVSRRELILQTCDLGLLRKQLFTISICILRERNEHS